MEKKINRRIKDRKFWITLISVIVCVYILVSAILGVLFMVLGGIFVYLRKIAPNLNATVDRDIAHYREYPEEIQMQVERLQLLPQEITSDMIVNDYFFQDASFKYYKHSQYHIFLDITYTTEAYAEEISRLQTYQTDEIEEKCFSYEAYAAIYNGAEGAYEYALIIGDNRIVYTYLYGELAQNDLRVPKYYLPKDYYDIAADKKVSYDFYQNA